MQDIRELIEKDRQSTERAKIEHPEAFERTPLIDTTEILADVGITAGIPANAPVGYIKLFPQDFIVEEIIGEDELVSIAGNKSSQTNTSRLPTLYADLVKCDLETLEARHRIAHTLNISEDNVGFAGMKDRSAITAQRISIRNFKNELPEITTGPFFLRFHSYGKGVLRPGDLKGNRFTITVRLQTEEDARIAASSFDQIKFQGFWNFFHLQRFAAPRLLGHVIGKALVMSDYEEAFRIMITEPGVREIPLFATMRREAKKIWKSWDKLYEHFKEFPYQFRYERTALEHLIKNREDYAGALKKIPDHAKLCIYGYQSYLWNRLLSDSIKEGRVPPELPFASTNPEFYTNILNEEGIERVEMPRILTSQMGIPVPVRTLVFPEIHAVEVHGALLIVSFDLPKGAYATSLLMHAIQIASDLPVPPGIPTNLVDAPALLGRPSIESILQRFARS